MIAARFLGRPQIGLQAMAQRRAGRRAARRTASATTGRAHGPSRATQEAYALADVAPTCFALYARLAAMELRGSAGWSGCARSRDGGGRAWSRRGAARRGGLPEGQGRAPPRRAAQQARSCARSIRAGATRPGRDAPTCPRSSSSPARRCWSWRSGRPEPPPRICEGHGACRPAVHGAAAASCSPRSSGPWAARLEDCRGRQRRLAPRRSSPTPPARTSIGSARGAPPRRRGSASTCSVVLPQRLLERLARAAPADIEGLGQMEGLRRWRWTPSVRTRALRTIAVGAPQATRGTGSSGPRRRPSRTRGRT